jgi:flagellar protein FliO/FliZ
MKSLTIIRGVALSAAFWLLRAAPTLAAGGESTPLHLGGTGSSPHASSGSSSTIIRTVVGLLVVIVVIYGVSWILRQFKSSRSRATGSGLSQVATLPLGSGRSVSLIRVGNELVLLGVAEQGVSKLRSYTEQEALAHGLVEDPAESPQAVELEPRPGPRSWPSRLALPAGTTSPSLGRIVETIRAMTVRQ